MSASRRPTPGGERLSQITCRTTQTAIVGDADYCDLVTLFAWAYEVAEFKLADELPLLWAHVQGAARRARQLRPLSGRDADLLEAAAILHDIGYAPDLAYTDFHPLDGAVFLGSIDAPVRLVDLVAHHSYALLEADLRALSDELTDYHDERGSIRDALWYCDLTTAPNGDAVDARERIAEIKQRYRPDDVMTQFILRASGELLAATDRTSRRLQVVSTLA